MTTKWRNENETTKRIRRKRRIYFLLLDMLLQIDMKWLTFNRTLTRALSLLHIILMTFWRTNCQICIHFVLLTFNLINNLIILNTNHLFFFNFCFQHSNSNRNFRLANRIKLTHLSLKLDLTINLIKCFSM